MIRLTSFIFVGVLFPALMFAQSLGINTDQVTLDVRPRIVQPQKPVDIEVVSYQTDIDRAQISLYVDGVLVEQGVGLKKFTVAAPRVGENTQVRIVVRTVNQGTIEKVRNLRPSQVDLLYEATNSYVPVMYKGKKLPAHEGGVRVVAMPYMINDNGTKIDPNSLVYSWSVEDQPQPDKSGYGRNTFEFEGSPYYRTKSVSVQVESVDGLQVAERTIEIPAFDPVVRFYQEHPLWGLDTSNAIIADEPLLLGVSEMAVRSVPYFISDADSRTQVEYNWRMNGQPMTTYRDRNIINLRVPDDGTGRARVNLEIKHNEKILQIAESLFTVVFGEEAVERAREQGEDSNRGQDFFGVSSN